MSGIFESTPAKGAVVRDWTNKTLVLEMKNSLGEFFHFENEPGCDDDELPARHPGDKTLVEFRLPILKA